MRRLRRFAALVQLAADVHDAIPVREAVTGKQNQPMQVFCQMIGASVTQALIVNRGVAVAMMAVHVVKHNVDFLFVLVKVHLQIVCFSCEAQNTPKKPKRSKGKN
jgi:hypothetical protein